MPNILLRQKVRKPVYKKIYSQHWKYGPEHQCTNSKKNHRDEKRSRHKNKHDTNEEANDPHKNIHRYVRKKIPWISDDVHLFFFQALERRKQAPYDIGNRKKMVYDPEIVSRDKNNVEVCNTIVPKKIVLYE